MRFFKTQPLHPHILALSEIKQNKMATTMTASTTTTTTTTSKKLDLSKYDKVSDLLKNRPADICAGGIEGTHTLPVAQDYASQVAFFNMLPLKAEQRAKLWATISQQSLPPQNQGQPIGRMCPAGGC